ncbi:diaphanous-like 3 isoform X1 [Sigmodon hispidus]
MERHRARALGRDSKAPRRKGLAPAPPAGPYEPGEKRPKLHLNIRTLTDDMLDRFASIRIPGSKKERPPLPNLKNAPGSSDRSSVSSETMENIPKPLSESEVLKLFEKMMEDMNLNEDKKAPLREKDFSIKKEMVMQYINTASKTGSLRSSRQISPQEFIHELNMGYTDERLFTYLESLRVSLTSNPVSWVQSFGHEGLGLLLDILEKLINRQIQERVVKKNQHKVIQCLKALMNTQYGLERIMSEGRSLSLLAKAMDPKQPSMMADVVKLLSAVCIVGEDTILEEVLEALTSAGEERKIDRFFPIVEGLRHDSAQLQVACMQLINALVTSPDDLDFRLHIRNEFMRCGLKEILPNLKCIKNDGLDIQLKVFDEQKEEDVVEFSRRLDDIRAELTCTEASDVYNMVWDTVKQTKAEGYFVSILQHLLLIRNDQFIRQQYFKLIDECVSQIVLHRDGMDPDFTYRKRLDLDLSQFVDVCIDLAKLEEYEEKASEHCKKFEKEFTDHQETQAQLQKKEAKINELQAELQAFKSQFGALPPGTKIPLQTLVEGEETSPSALLPAPPAPCGGVPPPPPLPPPPPPPPPLPGMALPIGGPVPPPPPLGFLSGQSSSPLNLPFGLKPKKEFKPEISMRRLNWLKIGPNEMSENCFWIKVNENKYENTDLLCKLENTFCCQHKAKRNTDDFEEKKAIKKRIKELKFLDPKIAQNLSIFLTSFRVPYEEIKTMILEVDETQLSESMIQNLLKHLPDEEQLSSLSQFRSDTNSLCEPEKFAVMMSNVKRLRPRLSAILFKLQFEEQVNNIRPDIMAVSTACEEIKKSKSFSKLLELVLLMGNYMNAGSRNAQTFGFDLSSLCKLKDIKSADQKTTLLHFLVDICEEKHPDILHFVSDLEHLDKASKVSVEMLERSLKQMGRQLQQLEKDLETFPPPEDSHDKFVIKMSQIFVISAKEQYEKLSKLLSSMTELYQSAMGYYAVDMKKVSVEDFLSDLNNFRTTFMQALKENIRKREAAEKDKRARIAKERAEKDRLERQLEKKRLLEMKTEGDETGVMDSLLEALQSGAAFRDRRKRTPKPKDIRQSLSPVSQRPVLKVCNHENQKGQLTEGSRPHHSINGNSTRTPVAKELNYNLDTPKSTGRIKAVEKEACNAESNRKKEMELLGSLSKRESVPEVEALLARLRAL